MTLEQIKYKTTENNFWRNFVWIQISENKSRLAEILNLNLDEIAEELISNIEWTEYYELIKQEFLTSKKSYKSLKEFIKHNLCYLAYDEKNTDNDKVWFAINQEWELIEYNICWEMIPNIGNIKRLWFWIRLR